MRVLTAAPCPAHLVHGGPAARVPPLQERKALVSAWPGLRESRKAYLMGKDFLLREKLPFVGQVCQPEK